MPEPSPLPNPPPADGGREAAWTRPAAVLIPALLGFAWFFPHVVGAEWVYDDRTVVAPLARAGVADIWTRATGYVWRPLGQTLQALAMHALGPSAGGTRSVNVLLHAANVGLVATIALRGGAPWRVAAAVAAAWTLHHALPDTVCWSADVGGVLSTTLVLTLVLAADTWSPRKLVPLVFPLTLLALLAKESAAPVVAVAALVHARRHGWRPALIAFASGVAAIGAWMVWHDHAAPDAVTGTRASLEAGIAWLQMAPWLAFPPIQAGVMHLFDPGEITTVSGGIVGVLGVVLGLRFRRLALPLTAWGLLLLPLAVGVPIVGLLPLRYAYTASAVAFALAAPLLAGRRVFVLLPWALLHAFVAAPRAHAWGTESALWLDELSREPDSPAVQWTAGRFLADHADDPSARRMGFDMMEAARPEHDFPGFHAVDAGFSLAKAAFQAGDAPRALELVDGWIATREASGLEVPTLAWCLRADARERIGLAVDAELEARCAAAK